MVFTSINAVMNETLFCNMSEYSLSKNGSYYDRPVILTNININTSISTCKIPSKTNNLLSSVYKFKLSDVVIYVHVNCLGEFNQHSQHPRAKNCYCSEHRQYFSIKVRVAPESGSWPEKYLPQDLQAS